MSIAWIFVAAADADDVRDRFGRARPRGEVGADHRRLGGDQLARLALGASSPGKTPPRIAPASRMWRTSARVSTPVIAGMPQSIEPVAPAALGAPARPRG